MAMNTSLLNKIAIAAAAGTAMPTIPALGANVASWTGWTTCGSINRHTDAISLASDRIAIAYEKELAILREVRSLAPDDAVLISRSVAAFTFSVHDGGQSLYTLDSAMTIATATSAATTGEFASSLTKRTVIVETNGQYLDYYPNCVVFVESSESGYGADGIGTSQVYVLPLAYTGYASGWKRVFYQAAG